MEDLQKKFDKIVKDVKKKDWKLAISTSAVLFTSFYSLQMMFQRALGTLKFHGGLPTQILSPIGLCTTAGSLYLSQFVEERTRKETFDYTFEPKPKLLQLLTPQESEKDKKRRLILSLGIFALLERGLYRTVFPSSVISIGIFSNAFNRLRYSVPATSELTTEAQRLAIQRLGKRFGCHQCGVRQIGSAQGFIADHMPPTKQALRMSQTWWRRLLRLQVQQRLWPQCQKCFLLQGSAVRANEHKLVYHSVFKPFHLAPVFAYLLMQEPSIAREVNAVLDPSINMADKLSKTVLKFIADIPKNL